MLLAPALFAAGGCGFRPLHGPVDSAVGGAPEDIAADLAAVRVANIPERFGQVLRRGLQRRLEDASPGTQARYLLNVAVSFSGEVLGYRRDGTISRLRYIASAEWNLATQAVPPQIIGRSIQPIRTIDAFNVPDLQFFAADTAREEMERRLGDLLGDAIYQQVLLAMRRYVANGRIQAARHDPAALG